MSGSNTREGGSAVKRPQGFGLPPQETGNPRAKPGGHKSVVPPPQDTAELSHQDDALLTGRKGRRAARGIRFAVASTKPERETESDSEVVDSSPDDRRERRALLALERERRQYERQEIRRFTTFQRRRRRMWALGLGSVTVVVIAVWAIAYSPLFALRTIRVEGTHTLPSAQVEAAFVPLRGTPLPLVTDEKIQKVLANFKPIETYSIEALPPHTLVIRVVERTAVGVFAHSGGGFELVDAAGVVIDTPAAQPAGQPLITVPDGASGSGFRTAAAVIRSLPSSLRSMLAGVSASTSNNVILQLASGEKIVWGDVSEPVLKAQVLDSLLRAAPPGSVSVYDVSSPLSPVTG
ncbi:MAG: hypothetical protein B5766_10540 [Candidatus Lumbricidophila eiseniae]|uniref:Uncharacterized protein n=1 Tax=Candidatus Lumbricidiphila eiseniae TaxID=1969409 RepID=A0A2A6FPK6_9MICO|nr:MAG: hypothetical protein B5766_10540 [Candidatus Lumbricidophila eiseniae]